MASVHDNAKQPAPAAAAVRKDPELDVSELIVLLTPPHTDAPATAATGAPVATAAPAVDLMSAAAAKAPAKTAGPGAIVGAAAAAASAASAAAAASASPASTSVVADVGRDQKAVAPVWPAAWIESAFKAAEKIAIAARVDKGRQHLTTAAGDRGDALLRALVYVLGVDGFAQRSRASALQGQCARALGNLCMADENRYKTVQFGGVTALGKRMKYSADPEMDYFLCGALGNLCYHNVTIQQAVYDAGILPLLFGVLRAARTPKCCLMVVRSFVLMSETPAVALDALEAGMAKLAVAYALSVAEEEDDGPNEVLLWFSYLALLSEPAKGDLRKRMVADGALDFVKKYLYAEDEDMQVHAVAAWLTLAPCNLQQAVPQAVRLLALSSLKARVAAVEGLLKLLREDSGDVVADLVFATFAPLTHCLKSTNKSMAAHSLLLLAALAARSPAHAERLLFNTPEVLAILTAALRGSDMVVAKAAIEVLVSVCCHAALKRRVATASDGAYLALLVEALALDGTRHPAVPNIHFSALLSLRHLVSGRERNEQAATAVQLLAGKGPKAGLKAITQFVFTEDEKTRMESGRLLLYLSQYPETRDAVLRDERAFVMLCAMAHMTAFPVTTPNALKNQFIVRVEVLQALTLWLQSHSTLLCEYVHYLMPLLSALSAVLGGGIAVRPDEIAAALNPVATANLVAPSGPAAVAGASATPVVESIDPLTPLPAPTMYVALLRTYLDALAAVDVARVAPARDPTALIQVKEMELHELKPGSGAAAAAAATATATAPTGSGAVAPASSASGNGLGALGMPAGSSTATVELLDDDDAKFAAAKEAKAAARAAEKALGAKNLSKALVDETQKQTKTFKLPIPVTTAGDAFVYLQRLLSDAKARHTATATAAAAAPATAAPAAGAGPAAAAAADKPTLGLTPADHAARAAAMASIDTLLAASEVCGKRWPVTPDSPRAATDNASASASGAASL